LIPPRRSQMAAPRANARLFESASARGSWSADGMRSRRHCKQPDGGGDAAGCRIARLRLGAAALVHARNRLSEGPVSWRLLGRSANSGDPPVPVRHVANGDLCLRPCRRRPRTGDVRKACGSPGGGRGADRLAFGGGVPDGYRRIVEPRRSRCLVARSREEAAIAVLASPALFDADQHGVLPMS
jgi:hypothetical protein